MSRKRNWLGRDINLLPAEMSLKEGMPPLLELGAATDVAAVFEADEDSGDAGFFQGGQERQALVEWHRGVERAVAEQEGRIVG